MDLYFMLLTIPSIFIGISPPVFNAIIIPFLSRFNGNEFQKSEIAIALFKKLLIFIVLSAVFGYIATTSLLFFKYNDQQSNVVALGKLITLFIWLYFIFSILSSFLSTYLQSNNKFSKVAISGLLLPLITIFSVLILNQKIGIISISIGLFTASFIQFIIFYHASFNSFRRKKEIMNCSYTLKPLYTQIAPVIISLLPFTILGSVGVFWASSLPSGSISFLSYGQSFSGFLSVATGMAVSMASFPKMTENIAKGNINESLISLSKNMRYVLIVSLMVASLFIALRVPILEFLYLSGNFTSNSVIGLSKVLPWCLIGAVSIACLNVLRNFYYASGNYKLLAQISLAIPFIFFIFAGILQYHYSYVGIGMANAISLTIYLFFVLKYADKNQKILFNKALIQLVGKLIIISTCAGISASISYTIIDNLLPQIISLILSSIIFTLFFIILSLFFKIIEINNALNYITLRI
ncbi:MAG: hypothetical protein HQ490_06010 [Lutibacter sp.]|nr:hypothetical protein [Lutibacter sp.]